jgi:hypothetical protein
MNVEMLVERLSGRNIQATVALGHTPEGVEEVLVSGAWKGRVGGVAVYPSTTTGWANPQILEFGESDRLVVREIRSALVETTAEKWLRRLDRVATTRTGRRSPKAWQAAVVGACREAELVTEPHRESFDPTIDLLFADGSSIAIANPRQEAFAGFAIRG